MLDKTMSKKELSLILMLCSSIFVSCVLVFLIHSDMGKLSSISKTESDIILSKVDLDNLRVKLNKLKAINQRFKKNYLHTDVSVLMSELSTGYRRAGFRVSYHIIKQTTNYTKVAAELKATATGSYKSFNDVTRDIIVNGIGASSYISLVLIKADTHGVENINMEIVIPNGLDNDI